ncbi:catalase [Parvularcula sp. ZS-1/3]|uniref:Catalase n=1 Tax=Parvularcula mediterranea TaxID=2732508 RepID=A0A7Y3RMJ6_9PROT|nr:putative metalloprotease CJM1_0395 family protein [Parvularcula mediterranea]NNU16829.1 catalase [Parvularcula mediterranea]
MDLQATSPKGSRPLTQPEPRADLADGGARPSEAAPAQAVTRAEETPELGDKREERRAGELTDGEKAVVQKLKARDREVRAHEQAHKAVGGEYAGAISYDYQRGPDGQNYAIGGSVPIDTSTEPTPEETIIKMQVVIRAALAPAEPSGPDRAIAAAAQAKLAQAQADLQVKKAEERTENAAKAGRAVGVYAAAEQDQSTTRVDVAA